MNLLVTAGNTLAPIDRVRGLTNVFTGRTGAGIAAEAIRRGHAVTLLTSHPHTATDLPAGSVRPFVTFDDLAGEMGRLIPARGFDAVIHSAAVSDYACAGVFAGPPGEWSNAAAGKVRGNHPELWLKLVPAPKLVDKVRTEWGFRGVLVKFKLEVGATDAELLAVAERSRAHSGADLMVANTLDGAAAWAFVGAGTYDRVPRGELAAAVISRVEALAGA